MKTCFIIDDERPAIKVLESYVKKIPELKLVGAETNPLRGIIQVNNNNVDIVFLDIQMDEMNGLQVTKELHKNCKVIFCTAYSEFAVESYELDAVDYLMKPISFDRFDKAVHRALYLQAEKNITPVNEKEVENDYIFLKTESKGKMIKVDLSDIDFVEGRSNYVAFHIGDKVVLTYTTLHELEETLPKSSFMRVHKSYIISIKKVVAIENNELKLANQKVTIPLSPFYKEAFFQHIGI